MELTDTYSIFHTDNKEYTFCLAAWGSFAKTDHILEYKAKFYKFKKNK